MVTIDLGHHTIVVDMESAVRLVKILEKAERYENKYWTRDERKAKSMPDDQDYTFHVYPNDHQYRMVCISDDMYRMAKLAGKPERK